VKVQNPPKSASKEKKVSWQAQYRKEMLNKSKQAKGDILETLEKIKAGQTASPTSF